MRIIALAALLTATPAMAQEPAQAHSTTGTLSVGATVVASCHVDSGALYSACGVTVATDPRSPGRGTVRTENGTDATIEVTRDADGTLRKTVTF